MSFHPGDNAGRRVDAIERGAMEALHDLGFSYREIARMTHRGKNAVERALNPAARERDRKARVPASGKSVTRCDCFDCPLHGPELSAGATPAR
jgi:DNA invertase Pin-like site-specific DNA recombinase